MKELDTSTLTAYTSEELDKIKSMKWYECIPLINNRWSQDKEKNYEHNLIQEKVLFVDGYETSVEIGSSQKIYDVALESTVSIILYQNNQGAHYVMAKPAEDGKLHFYNFVYGEKNHILDYDEFMDVLEEQFFASLWGNWIIGGIFIDK